MEIDVAKIKSVLTTGLAAKFGPEILKGWLVNFFKTKNLDVNDVTEWVLEKKNLWESIGPEHQEQMKRASLKLPNLNFLNVAWAVDGLKKDFPAVASLFLGWPKAKTWLQKELDNIKKQIQS